jgi:hypothetical protein
MQIEQREIRPLAFDDRDRFLPRRGFANQEHIFERSQQCAQKRPCRSLVVRNHHTKPRVHTALRSDSSRAMNSTGSRIVIVIPRPGAVSTVSDAASPY